MTRRDHRLQSLDKMKKFCSMETAAFCNPSIVKLGTAVHGDCPQCSMIISR